MPQAAPIQNSFNTGEIDPKLVGRVDYERMRAAMLVCLNGIPRVTGPWTRRTGSHFCDEVKDSTKRTRCYKFKYSTIQAYVLEFGEQYVRFKKNHAPVYDLTLTVTAATAANPVVLTYTGTDPSNGDHLDLSGVGGMTQLNGRRFTVANVDTGANTLELQTVDGVNVNGTAFSTYTSGGSAQRVYTLATPYLETDLFTIKFTQNADTLYIWHPDYQERTLTRTSDSNWTLATTVLIDGPYLPVNTTTTTLTPSAATGIGITITTGPIGTITGTADNGVGLIRITDNAHGYSDGIQLVISGVTGTTEANGTWTITVITDNTYDLVGSAFVNAYVAGGSTRPAVFVSTDVGRLIRMKQGSVWGYVQISAFTDATSVEATVVNTLTSTAAKTTWRLGLYSDTTGYPACGGFHGDRLYRSGPPYVPDRIDGSMVSSYLDLSTTGTDGTVTDENAVSFRLNSDDVQTIRWMRGLASGLAIGTFEGEWLLTPSVNQEAVTPTNIHAKQSTSWGSADVQVVRCGSILVFIEAGGTRVRELNYLYYENVLQSPDMTILSDHISRGNYNPADPLAASSTAAASGLIELDFVKKPIPSLWAVRNDGVLIGATYNKDEKVLGWHRHVLGGWSNAGKTVPALVESATVIPSSDGSVDELWLVVNRYINGRTVRYNEYLLGPWEHGTPQEDAFFLDSGLTYDSTPTTTVTGLYHLAGETVSVLVDGATHANVTVSSTGGITVTHSGSVLHVGYGYNSDGKCLRFDAGAMDGTAQGKIQRTHRTTFRFHETLGAQVGPTFETLRPINFRSAADLMGSPPPLFTGDKVVPWEGNYTTENYICWRFSDPLPGEILAVMPKLHTQDGL